jgi:hypothetical protein
MATSAQIYGWHLAVLKMGISVSKKNTASIFRVGKPVELPSSTTVRWNLKVDSHDPSIRRGLHNIRAFIHGVSGYHSTDNHSNDPFIYSIGLNGYNEMIISLNIYAIN